MRLCDKCHDDFMVPPNTDSNRCISCTKKYGAKTGFYERWVDENLARRVVESEKKVFFGSVIMDDGVHDIWLTSSKAKKVHPWRRWQI